jgi:hypothetical protein
VDTPRVRIYLDQDSKPFLEGSLPLDLPLDTWKLTDGPHRLIVRARDGGGREG